MYRLIYKYVNQQLSMTHDTERAGKKRRRVYRYHPQSFVLLARFFISIEIYKPFLQLIARIIERQVRARELITFHR